MQEMLSEGLLNPAAWIFMLQEETNLYLVGKNVLIVVVPILTNKNVFESSYNDLKFTIKKNSQQKLNCFCTKLILKIW